MSSDDLRNVARSTVLADAFLRCLSDGLYVVDRQGRLLSLNPAGERLLGYQAEELHGRDIHQAIHFQDGTGAPFPRERCPLLNVLVTGEATRVASDWFTRRDGSQFEVGYSSSPVVESGEVTGAVVIFNDITERRAVEREAQRLTDERTDAGAEWQRNLLPGRLHVIPDIETAVSFRPVGRGALIGGDFYDIISAAGDHLLVVGDVRGKGPGAASIGAIVRFLLRGAAAGTGSVAGLVGLVNHELGEHPSSRFCTLVIAHLVHLDDGSVQASVTCAGHPPAVLLTADGQTRAVGGTGPLLGVFDRVEIEPETVTLGPGDSLTLYTDGLTDAGRRITREPVDVIEILRGVRGTAAEIVTALEHRAGIMDVEDSPDDVAILTVRLAQPDAQARHTAPAAPSGPAPLMAEDIGEVEADARTHNERLVAGRPDAEPVVAVRCECGHPPCTVLIEVPQADYDRVRKNDRSFLIAPGHEIPRVESVIERRPAFIVVAKHGAAGDVAAAAAELKDDE